MSAHGEFGLQSRMGWHGTAAGCLVWLQGGVNLVQGGRAPTCMTHPMRSRKGRRNVHSLSRNGSLAPACSAGTRRGCGDTRAGATGRGCARVVRVLTADCTSPTARDNDLVRDSSCWAARAVQTASDAVSFVTYAAVSVMLLGRLICAVSRIAIVYHYCTDKPQLFSRSALLSQPRNHPNASKPPRLAAHLPRPLRRASTTTSQ